MTGNREVTAEQALEVWRLKRAMEQAGLQVCVHWNRCGCCISVHEDVENPSTGFIVGADGESELA